MSPEKNLPERSNTPRLPELPSQLEESGQAFLDALLPDEAAREMHKLHDGSIPVEAAARDAIRLGYALGYKVEKTDDEDRGRAVFRWIDGEGNAVYEGPAQDNFAQLALMFAAKRREYLDGGEELRTEAREFSFTMPFNVIESTVIVGTTIPQPQVEQPGITLDSVQATEPILFQDLPQGEITAYDLLSFSFGPSRAKRVAADGSKGIQWPLATETSQTVQAEQSQPQAVHIAAPERPQRPSRSERAARLRRKVTAGAVAAATLISGIVLSADSSFKSNQAAELPPKTASKKGYVEPAQPKQVVAEVRDAVGDFTVTSLSGNVQFIQGSMNQGRNPWQMTEDALHIAGLPTDNETVTQADPYLQDARTKRAAQHLGAGAVMSWRVVRGAEGTRLLPQPLPFQG